MKKKKKKGKKKEKKQKQKIMYGRRRRLFSRKFQLNTIFYCKFIVIVCLRLLSLAGTLSLSPSNVSVVLSLTQAMCRWCASAILKRFYE